MSAENEGKPPVFDRDRAMILWFLLLAGIIFGCMLIKHYFEDIVNVSLFIFLFLVFIGIMFSVFGVFGRILEWGASYWNPKK